jgi:hypothetical protein
VAKDAHERGEDDELDVLDVVDLLTDEPVPTGRRLEPEPERDEANARTPNRRRRILALAIAAVVAIVGVSVVVTRDDNDPEGVGIAEEPESERDVDRPDRGDPPPAADLGPDVWRMLGARFGLGLDTQALIVDGTTGTVERPRTLPDGAVRVVGGHSGALSVVAGDELLVLDDEGRVTDSDDATVFPGADPGLWWIAHFRNLTPLIGRANTVIAPADFRPVAAVRDGFVLQDPNGALVLWTNGGEPRPIAPVQEFSVVAVHPDRIAWIGACPGDACGVHVTEVASGGDALLPPGLVPMFDTGRAFGRFSPDGRYLALQVAQRISDASEFVLIDLASGNTVTRLDIGVRMPPPGTTGLVEAVPFDFTPDGRQLVVADWTRSRGRLVVFNAESGAVERTLERVGRVSTVAALDRQPIAATTPLATAGAPPDRVTGATLAIASGTGEDFTTVDIDSGRQRHFRLSMNMDTSRGDFQPRLVALDGGFAWMLGGEAYFAPPDATPVRLGEANYVMAGGVPEEGWTVKRTDAGWDLTRFDGRTGALGETYHTAASPEGAVRDGLVVARPASFTRGSDIEIWNPVTGRSRSITIPARAPMITAAGGTRVVWFDQACSGAQPSCGTRVTDTETGETHVLPENAYPFSASATTPTGRQLYVQVESDQGASHLASIDLATMQPTDVPGSENVENWAASSGGVVVFARGGDLYVWAAGWPEPRFLSGGGFGMAAGVAVR